MINTTVESLPPVMQIKNALLQLQLMQNVLMYGDGMQVYGSPPNSEVCRQTVEMVNYGEVLNNEKLEKKWTMSFLLHMLNFQIDTVLQPWLCPLHLEIITWLSLAWRSFLSNHSIILHYSILEGLDCVNPAKKNCSSG